MIINPGGLAFTNKCRGFLQQYVPDFKRCFVTGGIFPRIYHDLPVRDVDVYVGDDGNFTEIVQEYIKNNSMEVVSHRDRIAKFRHKHTEVKVDLINFHKPKSIAYVNNFDFTICKGVYTDDRFFMQGDPNGFDHIMKKMLVFTETSMFSKNDNNILVRIKKYQDLGFTIDNDELTKIYQHLTSNSYKKDVAFEEVYGT